MIYPINSWEDPDEYEFKKLIKNVQKYFNIKYKITIIAIDDDDGDVDIDDMNDIKDEYDIHKNNTKLYVKIKHTKHHKQHKQHKQHKKKIIKFDHNAVDMETKNHGNNQQIYRIYFLFKNKSQTPTPTDHCTFVQFPYIDTGITECKDDCNYI